VELFHNHARKPTARGTPVAHGWELDAPFAYRGGIDPHRTPRVLILGGTVEARELATALHEAGLDVTTSLAGRVTRPAARAGTVRVGGFGGVDGLSAHLTGHGVDVLVDVTHPFAAQMSAHAAAAAARTATPLLAVRRPHWTEQPGDDWRWVDDVDAAARAVADLGARRVLLTTGRQELAAFAANGDAWFLARSVEPPDPPFPRRLQVLLDRGPFTVDGERALLDRHAVDLLVTKDSGGTAAAAKLQAARERGIAVVMVRRPPSPAGVLAVETVAAARSWVLDLVRGEGGLTG
jgi:precorrin-6A/cobalt-precorrin-6A reductase